MHYTKNPMRTLSPLKILLIHFLSLFFLLNTIWLNRKFGQIDFEQLIYHFQFGFKGIATADGALVNSYLKYCILIPFAVSSLTTILEILLSNTKSIDISFLYKEKNIKIHAPLNKKIIQHFKYYLTLFCFFILIYNIGFFTHIKSQISKSSFIEDNYSKPIIKENLEKKENLVLIYVESLENTYSDGKLFQKDLLKEINSTTKDWISFDQYKQFYGTGWTIASIVSTQCGIPLKTRGYLSKDKIYKLDGNQIGENAENFLPNAYCLGDFLKENGYQNIFLGGADSNFAGKGKFLKEHGYDQVLGRNYWASKNKDIKEGWGLFDDELLKEAKIKFKELYVSKTPFNLTLLTVDTHHPSGHLSSTCQAMGAASFTEIIECTSYLLSDFVSFIQENDTLKNTNIIIIGDHLSMKNDVYDKLENQERFIYNKFFSHNEKIKTRDLISHFSIFPTILDLMNFEINNGIAGLGISGFHNTSKEELNQRKYLLIEELPKKSEFYKQLWNK